MVKLVQCPQCNTNVEWKREQTWRPFCSERCKLIDLGEWASEGHRIAGDPINTNNTDDDYNHSDYH